MKIEDAEFNAICAMDVFQTQVISLFGITTNFPDNENILFLPKSVRSLTFSPWVFIQYRVNSNFNHEEDIECIFQLKLNLNTFFAIFDLNDDGVVDQDF